jgi:small subunit ribosomal protein S16
MVVIRLARFGSKHEPRYRITVADSRRWLKGRFIEVIGSYNPVASGQDKELVLDVEKAQSWIAKGAQPTQTVKTLIRKAGAKTVSV